MNTHFSTFKDRDRMEIHVYKIIFTRKPDYSLGSEAVNVSLHLGSTS